MVANNKLLELGAEMILLQLFKLGLNPQYLIFKNVLLHTKSSATRFYSANKTD